MYRTPIGRITLACNGEALTHAAFGPAVFESDRRACALTNQASNEVLEYLAGKRRSFSVPIDPAGSAFQKKVWGYLMTVPYGQTRSYAQVANDLGNPKGVNAISTACSRNPLPFFIPSHRVIGVHGDVGGFVADPAIKQFLIDLEARMM